ncbi:MAG: rRNA maturation RNase YbeY [Acidimicrobiia bacterium]|nr:rRNA maturation RNase YbeY [Acidimicrobiia bacterium]
MADEQDDPLDTETLRSLAELVLVEEGFAPDTEMTLFFVSDEVIADYNSRFMQRVGPTDVLAFPLEHLQPGVVPERVRNGPPVILGDVFIAPSYVSAQAGTNGISFDDEIALMVVHGILHLLGYDHGGDEVAEQMEERERRLLQLVGRTRA